MQSRDAFYYASREEAPDRQDNLLFRMRSVRTEDTRIDGRLELRGFHLPPAVNVTLLVDSLIRGWPFGTLLLWRVQHDEKRNIPSRAFWQVMDRTDDEEGTPLMEQQPPAEYQMVLDGQQGIQSLLLATHGDNWGFRLKDRDWSVEVGTKSVRGGSATAHWSQGCLCLDLEKFLVGYAEAKQQLTAVAFEKAFVWAVTDEQNGRSKTRRTKSYKEAIPSRFSSENSGKLIRFSRLWQLAGINAGLKEKNYHEPIRNLLSQHGVADGVQEQAVAPLALDSLFNKTILQPSILIMS